MFSIHNKNIDKSFGGETNCIEMIKLSVYTTCGLYFDTCYVIIDIRLSFAIIHKNLKRSIFPCIIYC